MKHSASAPFTLHLRLTHACNAECSYCSSWQKDPDERMRPADLARCLDGLDQFWALAGIAPSYLNVEYVGGEILLIPPSELAEMVSMVRDRFGRRMIVRDGAQSNLIGSSSRLSQLSELFQGRVGTSIDHFSDQRQLPGKGSASERSGRYKTFFMQSSNHLKAIGGHATPGVITLDRHNLDKVCQEIEVACADQRDITFRPVFQGGCQIDSITDEDLGVALAEGFKHWMKLGMRMRIEPFVSLFRRRLTPNSASGFCAWQRDCAMKSLSIEPNGDFYVCQELADSDNFKLGNLINKEFKIELHQQLSRRIEMLDKGCFECPYFRSCQGGCMQQSVESGAGMYGKTQWCLAWKRLFASMDTAITEFGRERLLMRLNALHPEF